MAEMNEILVSLVILLFILLLFYIKFGKKIAPGEIFGRIRGTFKGTLGGAKRPKLSWGSFLVIAVLVLVAGIFVWDFTHTTTYAFSEKEFNKYWTLESGSVTFDKGYMQTSAGAVISLKNSEDMDWTKTEIVSAQRLGKTMVSAGIYDFLYFSGTHPLRDNYGWVKLSSHFVGGFQERGGKMGYSEPRDETRDDGQAYNTFVIERGKGFYILPNYKSMIGGVGGYFDSVDLIASHGRTKDGKGKITITFSDPGKIESFTVTEGLLKF